MYAHEQVVERKPDTLISYNFSIEHKLRLRKFGKRFHNLRKIAVQRLSRLRLQLNIVTLAKCQAAKAIPFRLVKPAFAAGNIIDGLRLRGRIRRTNRQPDWL